MIEKIVFNLSCCEYEAVARSLEGCCININRPINIMICKLIQNVQIRMAVKLLNIKPLKNQLSLSLPEAMAIYIGLITCPKTGNPFIDVTLQKIIDKIDKIIV